jgi:hypothetical protein
MDTTPGPVIVTDGDGWKRLRELLTRLLGPAVTTADNAEHAASVIYTNLIQSKVFGDLAIFTPDMLRRLEPDPIRADFKLSVAKYTPWEVREGKDCESLSRDLFESKFKHALFRPSSNNLL